MRQLPVPALSRSIAGPAAASGKREGIMHIRVEVLSACMLLSAVPAAWANGGGAMEMPQANSREESPQDKAKERYNDGVRAVRKADRFQDSAAQLVDPAKKERALYE